MKKFGLIEENKRGRKRKKIPYEKLLNDCNTMVEELEALRSIVEDITTLRKENERLKSENDELHIEVEKLIAENETLSYKLFE
jgi:cell division protein FtsB